MRAVGCWIRVCCLAGAVTVSLAANWAQSSGEVEQNIAIPYIPAPDSPHWGARYGHATAIMPSGNLSSQAYLFLFGGDTYDGDDTQRNFKPGLLDLAWENGYKNDVWSTTGTEWFVKGDVRLQTEHNQKIPRVYSKLQWSARTSGFRPPLGMTHDDWISCTSFFRNRARPGVSCTDERAVMWSPRRSHAGVYFKGYIWVLGGRAREFVDLPEEQSIGGILHPRVQDVYAPNFKFSTQREVSVYKSDVWRSLDGKDWELVTPGCHIPQKGLIAAGNPHEKKFGREMDACTKDADCYGAEVCDLTLGSGTCVCSIWSPREQHAVAAYGDYMYLTGGYASRLYSTFSNCAGYACGNMNAGDYRYYLSDVWRSADGEVWKLITESAFTPLRPDAAPLGRGGHQMLALQTASGDAQLWVIGGRGGDNTYLGGPEVCYNDIWTAPISGDPVVWTALQLPGGETAMSWQPRTGLSAAMEIAAPENLYQRTLYIYGGQDLNGSALDDLWSWHLDDPTDHWRQDYTPDALYSYGTGKELAFAPDSPAVYYVSPDSPLTALRRWWVSARPNGVNGTRYELRPYIPQSDLETMASQGLRSIRDLANSDLYTVLRLRGFDIPQVPQEKRLSVPLICDYRAFARAVVDKCQLNVPSLYDGERQMPWNIVPEFGGAAPNSDKIKWHGRTTYDMLLPETTDVVERTAAWDGCTYDALIQGLHGPNVNGIGYVTQVTSIRNSAPEVANLFCRQSPGPRSFASMAAFDGKIYLFGGKSSTSKFNADTWYRDAKLPSAKIVSAPSDHSPSSWFFFSSNEPGSYYEYRVWDPYNYKELRAWTPVTFKTSVAWLNWREGGPGNGEYMLYVRAVDPAGNRDDRFIMGVNVYRWYYVSPTPWDIIGGLVGAFVGLCIIAYFEYRRRVKKAAMERYAMKRMRRKFKAMQRDVDGRAVDWRTLYMESKQAEDMGKRERKKLKKTRDKNAEKREQEKKKREKEKELIKRKLKANKEKVKAAKSSKESGGDGGATRRSQVAPTLEAVPEEEGDLEAALSKKTRAKPSMKASTGGGQVAAAGDEDTGSGLDMVPAKEEGFKARKVNKRYKAYEQGVVPGDDASASGQSLFEGSSKDK